MLPGLQRGGELRHQTKGPLPRRERRKRRGEEEEDGKKTCVVHVTREDVGPLFRSSERRLPSMCIQLPIKRTACLWLDI